MDYMYPLFIEEIDLNKCIFTDIKKINNDKNIKLYSNILYNDNSKLYIQSNQIKFIYPITKIGNEYYLYIFLFLFNNILSP